MGLMQPGVGCKTIRAVKNENTSLSLLIAPGIMVSVMIKPHHRANNSEDGHERPGSGMTERDDGGSEDAKRDLGVGVVGGADLAAVG